MALNHCRVSHWLRIDRALVQVDVILVLVVRTCLKLVLFGQKGCCLFQGRVCAWWARLIGGLGAVIHALRANWMMDWYCLFLTPFVSFRRLARALRIGGDTWPIFTLKCTLASMTGTPSFTQRACTLHPFSTRWDTRSTSYSIAIICTSMSRCLLANALIISLPS